MPQPGCLAREELDQFLSGTISALGREQVEAHLSNCRACRRYLVTIHHSSQSVPSSSAPQWLKAKMLRIPWRSSSLWLPRVFVFRRSVVTAIALLLIAAAGVVLFLEQQRPQHPATDTLREGIQETAAPRLLSPVSGAVIPSRALDFRWMQVQGIDGYAFTLLSETGDILFQTDTGQGRLTLTTQQVHLEKGKTYFWYVAAKLPSGTTVDSEIRKFVLSKE